MLRIERIRAAAQESVGRGCFFAFLGVTTFSISLISWPWLAMKAEADLMTLGWLVLLLRSRFAQAHDYRRTETWLILERRHGLPEPQAQTIIARILAETYRHYADLAAKLALFFWALCGAFWVIAG